MSHQAKNLELYDEAVKLAEAARQGYTGQSPRVRAMLNLRAAQAYASVGEAKQCRAAVDLAYDALRGQPTTSGEPAWCYWMDDATVNHLVGSCYINLEDWGRAQRHLQTALRLQADPVSADTTARQALLATTYARQGDPEHACQIGEQAVDILAGKVDSAYCVGQVRRLQAALSHTVRSRPSGTSMSV
jgi:tetratricopeptide (TPR) repeat protein